MADYATLLPVNVVTGFLGSGKTTLLQRLLASPALADTAVLVNEFGEVGLDHHLLQHVAESTVLMSNGCVCCAIRDDLGAALRELLSGRDRGALPPFRRVVVETSGLADPVPIAHTVLAEPVVQHHYRLGNLVAVADAVNVCSQLRRYRESRAQVAAADRLVLTKTDLCEPDQREAARAAVARLNPSALLIEVGRDEVDPEVLLREDAYDGEARGREIARFRAGGDAAGADPIAHDHAEGVESFTLRLDGPIDWTAFGIWLTMLLNRHGERVLRVKGLLNVAGLDAPVLVNGAQHIVHPPSHLGAWPDDDHSSRIVFIVDGLEPARLRASLDVFNRLAA